MSGALGRIDLMPPADISDVQESLATAFDDAMDDLRKQGILPTDGRMEGYRGEMPKDLTSLNETQIGDLLNKLSVWCGFMDVELGKADAQYNSSKDALDTLKRNIRIWFKKDDEGKRLTGPDKDDRVENDPRVVAAKRMDLMCYTKFRVIRGISQQAQRNWETVSRQITLMGQQAQRNRRDVNVGGAPVQGRTFLRRPMR